MTGNADMNKVPEAVTTKFVELFAALHSATDDLKMAGAEACLIGDFSQVTVINDSYRKLQAFEAEIKDTLNNFNSKYKAQSVEKAEGYKNDSYRTRKSGGRLRVTLTGKVIEKPTIIETFVVTLKAFGLERVAKLNKVLTKIPLVARTPVVNGYQNQKFCDGWYITTHFSRYTAANMLEEIGKGLNTPIKIEFIEQ
jgi:hypothetical protein